MTHTISPITSHHPVVVEVAVVETRAVTPLRKPPTVLPVKPHTNSCNQSINGARATAVGDVIGIRGNEMLVQYGNSVIILNTAIADIKEKMDATYNFTTFNELDITTSGKTLKEITDELHALNLPTNTVVTGQLYSDALPFSGNGEAEVMINKPAYWWKCTSLNVAPYSWNAIAGGGTWSGIIMDWTPTYNPATTYETTGSGNAITDASYSNGKLTFTKGSTFLTGHPTITPGTNTTSTAAPAVGETFTAIDGITKDANGHVTAINTKTVTMPTPTKSNVGLSEVTNDKQIKGLSTGTTAGNLVKFGNDGYTVADAGVGIETGFTSNSDAKVPTSKSITTNVAGNAKLTGYSVDTARGNINADSTITDAVEQLEYREETNKNNILSIYNQNGKTFNIIDWSNFGGNSDTGISYSYANDTITATGTKLTNDSYLSISGVSSVIKPNTWYALVCATTGSPRISARIFGFDGSTYTQLSDSASLAYFNSGNYQSYIGRIVVGGSSGDSVNATIKPMLIEKSIYDAGFTDFQPYTLPNTTITPVLKECVDNGAKNELNVTSVADTSSNISATINADKSISFTVSSANSRSYLYINGSAYKANDKAGKLLVGNTSGNGNVYFGITYSNNGSSWASEKFVNSDTPIVIENYPYYKISCYFEANTTISTAVIIKPMLCTEAEYKASQTYQPYAMSNVELTEEVTTLNQASQYNMVGAYNSETGRTTFAALYRLALETLGLDTSVLHHYIVHVYTNTVSPTADLLIMYGTYYHNNSVSHAVLYNSQISYYADNTQGTLVVSGGDNTIHASVCFLD